MFKLIYTYMKAKVPQSPKKQHRVVKVPYFKRGNYIFYKKIEFNIRSRYKKVTYLYEKYDSNGELIDEYIHAQGDNPAVLVYRNNVLSELQYWKHGNKHREWNPAIMILDSQHKILSEKWYVNNKKLKEDEIEDKKKIIDRRKKMYRVILKMFGN